MKKVTILIVLIIILVTIFSIYTNYKYEVKTKKLQGELAELLRRKIDDYLNYLNYHCDDNSKFNSLKEELLRLKSLSDKELNKEDIKKKIQELVKK